ncbi:MAG: GIY-YIG nuclease family protein [Richelia sp. RM1_1_1]|nr:GIY-YIG nuclease family protein [Richelia sp. RM1_1_1]
MEWKNWASVAFSKRNLLPSCSGIYIIIDANDCVWYVGQAANLKNRWMGRTHHRYPQLIRSNRKLCHRIYWQEFPFYSLDERERYYIDLFKPELNGCKVKKYLPKQPQVEREIKRLLKVLNKLTTLFTVIRSVVVGEYEDSDGTTCFVIFRNSNDEKIIYKSMRKRYASEVRKAWSIYKSYCGKDEQLYSQAWVYTYNLGGYKFEFIIVDWEFFDYFTNNSDARTRYIGEAELNGVKVKVLKDFSIFDELSLAEESTYTNSEGKKSLTSVAYINYRRPILKCIVSTIE